MKATISAIAKWTGMFLILAGMALPLISGPQSNLFKYIFSVGAALNFIGRLMFDYEGRNMRVRRLYRLETWSSLFFGVAAYFMFTDPNPRSWIVFVLAGGAILTYTSLLIPYTENKDNKK